MVPNKLHRYLENYHLNAKNKPVDIFIRKPDKHLKNQNIAIEISKMVNEKVLLSSYMVIYRIFCKAHKIAISR